MINKIEGIDLIIMFEQFIIGGMFFFVWMNGYGLKSYLGLGVFGFMFNLLVYEREVHN